MKSILMSILRRSVFSTYSKSSLKIFRYVYRNKELRQYLGPIVRMLSWLHPDMNTCFRLKGVKSIDDFGGAQELAQIIQPVYTAKPQYDKTSHPLVRIKDKKISLYRLPQVDIIGSTELISYAFHHAIYDSYCNEYSEHFAYFNQSLVDKFDDLFLTKYEKSNVSIDSGILLTANFSGNYYHLVYEVLCRFCYLEWFTVDPSIPLIVDEIVYKIPQFRELLSCFNVGNRRVIVVKRGHQYSVKSLYCLSAVNFVPPDYTDFSKAKYTDCFFDVESLNYLRRVMLANRSSRQFAKRIFLSRKNASQRRGYNEYEVAVLLEKYGFEIVCPEEYSVTDQIALFNGAELIVGATGAAFTNIIVCQAHCQILCITASYLDLSIFSPIAKLIKADLQYFSTNTPDYKLEDAHESFHVGISQFEERLIDWLNPPSDQ